MPNFSKLASSAPPPSPSQTHANHQHTRIPATRTEKEDDILDNTFGDSLASLSDRFSSVPSDEFLEIIEDGKQHTDRSRRRPGRRDTVATTILVFCTAVVLCVVLTARKGGNEGGGGMGSADPTTAASAWEDVCSNESAIHKEEQRKRLCAETCRLYTCCADDASSCAETMPADCDRFWDLCVEVGVAAGDPPGKGAVHENEEQDEEQDDDEEEKYESASDGDQNASDGQGTAIPSPPSDLVDLCWIDTIATTEGRDACAQACKPGRCCIAKNIAESCIVENADACLDYQICNLLNAESNEEEHYAAIAAVCDGANREKEKFDMCSLVCEDRMCCFDMLGGGCKDIGEYECLVYKPCSVLIIDQAEEIVENVAHTKGSAELFSLLDTCSDESLNEPEKLEKCLKECKARECCFNPDDNCFDDAEGWCNEFVVCLNAFSQVTEELESAEEQHSEGGKMAGGG